MDNDWFDELLEDLAKPVPEPDPWRFGRCHWCENPAWEMPWPATRPLPVCYYHRHNSSCPDEVHTHQHDWVGEYVETQRDADGSVRLHFVPSDVPCNVGGDDAEREIAAQLFKDGMPGRDALDAAARLG